MGFGTALLAGCLSVAVAAGLASPVAAHPHVFIDTTVTAVLDAQGRLEAIRLRWNYDALLSMVVAEDRAADADMDGTISATEAKVLDGFDMTWIDGFDGDTTLFQDETPLPLVPGPQDWATGWVPDEAGGHLWSEHTRRLVAPVDPRAGPISIVVYDVTDYTAYTLTPSAGADPVEGASAACRIEPPSNAGGDGETGLLSTVGLFLFGGDESTEASVLPAPAKGRVVAVLTCD